jgi:probable F420-dependent oxidoreductase
MTTHQDSTTSPESSRVPESRIRIGVQLWPGGAPSYQTWRDAVLQAEDLGVDAIFGYDHFHKPFVSIVNGEPQLEPDQPDVNNFEGWTALASWAEITTRAEIGLLVSGMGFRNPDLLADMARTVDHISDGRLILGLGTGWYPKDYEVYGYDLGTVATRMALFADGVARIKHRLGQLIPAPVRDIPILIGGAGERKTLPLVGRYADIWHSFLDIETFRRKNDLVNQHAQNAGRDPDTIERAMGWLPGTNADAFADQGVTLFTTEIHPTDDGYDFTQLHEMLAWRS